MTRVLGFLFTMLCLLVLNSCSAGVGALVAVSAFGIEAYEEARVHRPDLKLKPIKSHIETVQNHLPSLSKIPFLSEDQPPVDKKEEKTSAVNSPSFGFACSRLESDEKKSKCFDDFSKILSLRKESEISQRKESEISQRKESEISQRKESEIGQKNVSYNNSNKPIATQKHAVSTTKKLLKEVINTPTLSQSLPSSYIKNWVTSWQEKNIDSYLSFYSKEFIGSEDNRGAWESSRHRALTKNKNITIELSNLQFQQNSKDKIKVNFTQNYKSDGFSDTGNKELTLLKKDTGWKIVKEEWMPISSTINYEKSAGKNKQINKNLSSWIKAWENKDINTYLSFYSENFNPAAYSHLEWLDSRHQALKTKKNLSINIKNLKITENNETVETNFIQEFNSDKYSDIGIKELVWIKAGSTWKILKETWISS